METKDIKVNNVMLWISLVKRVKAW